MKGIRMTIQVLGSGCPTCKKLYELTQEAVKQIGLEAKIEYITDVSKIIELGIMTSPVLVVNGKPVMTGFVPDIEKIKNLITAGGDKTKGKQSCAGCDCGGTCDCGC